MSIPTALKTEHNVTEQMFAEAAINSFIPSIKLPGPVTFSTA